RRAERGWLESRPRYALAPSRRSARPSVKAVACAIRALFVGYNGARQWSSLTESPYKGKRGFPRLWNALLCCFSGLSAALRHEEAFRLVVVVASVLVPTALLLAVTPLGKALMIASVMLVLIVELLN